MKTDRRVGVKKDATPIHFRSRYSNSTSTHSCPALLPPYKHAHVPDEADTNYTKMGVLRNILLAVLLLSFLTFVALFGQLPALRKTPIGWLRRLLCIHTPNLLKHLDHAATGGHVTRRSVRLGTYLFYEQNPVVLVRLPVMNGRCYSPHLIHLVHAKR